MTKFPAYGSSCAISNRLTENYRPCSRTGSGDRDFLEKMANGWPRIHAFIARTRAQREDFARAALTAVQQFEDSLQSQYDGQLRSRVRALQDECQEHVGQEEDKMRKELQHALTQEASMCHDQLHRALQQQACQEEYADAGSTRGVNQQVESHSQQL